MEEVERQRSEEVEVEFFFFPFLSLCTLLLLSLSTPRAEALRSLALLRTHVADMFRASAARSALRALSAAAKGPVRERERES